MTSGLGEAVRSLDSDYHLCPHHRNYIMTTVIIIIIISARLTNSQTVSIIHHLDYISQELTLSCGEKGESGRTPF